jgi:hypothetical protein
MEREATTGETIFGGAVVVLALSSIGFTAYPGWSTVAKVLWTAEAAAWVQALGSLAAIASGFIFVQRQAFAARKLEADKRHLDDLKKTEVVHQLFSEAAVAVSQTHNTVFGEHAMDAPMAIRQLEDSARALEAVPALEVPGSGLAIGVLRLPRALREFAASASDCKLALHEVRNSPGRPADIPSRMRLQYTARFDAAVALCNAGLMTSAAQIDLLKQLADVSD